MKFKYERRPFQIRRGFTGNEVHCVWNIRSDRAFGHVYNCKCIVMMIAIVFIFKEDNGLGLGIERRFFKYLYLCHLRQRSTQNQ